MKNLEKAVFATLVLASVSSQSFDFNDKCQKDSYYDGFEASEHNSVNSLKLALHDLVKDHNIIPYTLTDEAMLVLDAANDGTNAVIGVYSRIPKDPFPDDWNREHVWPRSRGIGDTGADTSDLHHLYPCDSNLNSARSNKYYDECNPGIDGCISPAGTASEDAAPGSSETSTTWAPPPSIRGDLARAVFYLAVRYDGSDSATTPLRIAECSTESDCGPNTFGRLSTLLKWNEDDPVDANEVARMEGICSGFQGNRNPFVDFPELASLVFDPATSLGESDKSVFGDSTGIAVTAIVVLAIVLVAALVQFARIRSTRKEDFRLSVGNSIAVHH